MAKKKKQRVKKGDQERVVLSETLPGEVPIIFSNDGYYIHCRDYKASLSGIPYQLDNFFKQIIIGKERNYIPFSYKIRKDRISFRTLSLLHPSWQYKVIKFYNDYSSLVCHYCSGSKISIRCPRGISGKFFYKSRFENMNKYKGRSVSTTRSDMISKHATSYFSYDRYDKEYKFFDSEEFLDLEKKYNYFWILDVSKCFESIYTHSIAWALKSKSFVKNHLQYYMFGEEFDTLMRSAKHNETNGIVIGPEISRIFAEIIFQDVDQNVVESLKHSKLQFDKDYTIRRYVDDIFIFSKENSAAEEAAKTISVELFKYNLHLNAKKQEKLSRPFFTKQSRVIFEIRSRMEEYFIKFMSKERKDVEDGSGRKYSVDEWTPKEIHSIGDLKKSFIHAVKMIASANEGDYSVISNFIVSCLARQLLDLIEPAEKKIRKKADLKDYYADAIMCLMETMFFFYTVEPSVTSSYKLARAIVIAVRFAKLNLQEYESRICQRILELFIKFYESTRTTSPIERKEAISLETVNILLALGEMGEDYLIPSAELEEIFKISSGEPSYFELMSCLYYIKTHSQYKELRNKVRQKIANRLKTLNDIREDAETIYILLDTLTCPYLGVAFKKPILKALEANLHVNLSSIGDEAKQLNLLRHSPWFINWENIDLLTLLEKKELCVSYETAIGVIGKAA